MQSRRQRRLRVIAATARSRDPAPKAACATELTRPEIAEFWLRGVRVVIIQAIRYSEIRFLASFRPAGFDRLLRGVALMRMLLGYTE